MILAFSFSFASERFEARRSLVVQEANDIGTMYLRASYLPAGQADRFRSILRDYTRARLGTFTRDPAIGTAMRRKATGLHDALWSIAVTSARADPSNVELGLLTQALNETIDISTTQYAELRNHMPTPVLRLVLIVALAAMIILGVHLTRTRWPQIVLALVSGFLLATVIAAIIDLDRPLSGLVRIDLTPLQTELQSMQ